MNVKLLKIYADDCPVCKSLDKTDLVIAQEANLELIKQDYLDLAASTGPVRDYVVHYHILPNEGIIDIPIYVIVRDDVPVASAVVKSIEDLQNLLDSWARFLKSMSSDNMIK